MFARLSAFVIWSLVSATAVLWALRFFVTVPQAPVHALAVDRAAPVRGDLTRLFGASPVVVAAAEVKPEAPSRFRLIGVMAPKSKLPEGPGSYGLALIAVDGKPAKAFAVGARVDSDLVLQSVGMRTASMRGAKGTQSVLLELPMLPAPATGVLPAPGSPMMGSPVNAGQPLQSVPRLAAPTSNAVPTMQPAANAPPAMIQQAQPPMASPAAPPPSMMQQSPVPPPSQPPADGFRSQ